MLIYVQHKLNGINMEIHKTRFIFRIAINVSEIGMNIKGSCQNVVAIIRVMPKAN